MSTKAERHQSFIRHYKRETGKEVVNMHDVAKFAKSKGYTMPTPRSDVDLLAKEFSEAAREEIRYDKKTGKPYRANHAYRPHPGQPQLFYWVDIDKAPRGPMQKSLQHRRGQMVGDAVQLTLDAMHWNSINPNEEPIQMVLDFADDVEERLSAPDEDAKAA